MADVTETDATENSGHSNKGRMSGKNGKLRGSVTCMVGNMRDTW